MDLGDAAMLGVPEGADQGDDIEAELVLREGVAAFLLGSEWDGVAWAVRVATASDLKSKPCRALQSRDGPLSFVSRPEGSTAGGAGSRECGQLHGLIGSGSGSPSGHGRLLEANGLKE
jgi:hypothetical protein